MNAVTKVSLIRFVIVGAVALLLGAVVFSTRAQADDSSGGFLVLHDVDAGSATSLALSTGAMATTVSQAVTFANSDSAFLDSAPTTSLSVFRAGEVKILIRSDGTVELAKGVSYSKAARAFWHAVEQSNPLRQENARLRRKLTACSDAR